MANSYTHKELIELAPLESVIVEGLLLGGIYSLAAIGISLIFSITNILNLAHGNFIMIGGVLSFIFYYAFAGSNPAIITLVVTLALVLLCSAFLGVATDTLLIKRIFRSKDIIGSAVLVTIGLALVLQDFGSYIIINDEANVSHTSTVALSIPNFGSFQLGGYYFASSKIVSLLAITLASVALFFFFKRTYLGLAMRSISQDREAASISGVNIRSISLLTFVLGSVFAGFAGFVLVIDQTVDPVLGIPYTIKLLTIMVLGGVRSPLGPVMGGILLGILESAVAIFFGAYWVTAASLAILISVLLVRPSGIGG
jgi:branched-chain amino acid transport system permease protein